MNPALRSLFDAARDAMGRAYAPYSRFQVGAAIRTADGRMFTGCNVENAAYPVGACAEAGAISAMINAGATKITEIAIIGSGDAPCYPCGGCRQRIREFSDDATRIHVADRTMSRYHSHGMNELLPHGFGPEMLPHG